MGKKKRKSEAASTAAADSGKSGANVPPSPAELEAAVAKNSQWASVIKALIYAICIPLSILALVPVTRLVAGENTVVDVNVVATLSLSVVFGVSAAGFASWGAHRNRAFKQARKEISGLRRKLMAAEAEVTRAGERLEELEGDLKNVRSDLARRDGS